jgi:hypothetical protein
MLDVPDHEPLDHGPSSRHLPRSAASGARAGRCRWATDYVRRCDGNQLKFRDPGVEVEATGRSSGHAPESAPHGASPSIPATFPIRLCRLYRLRRSTRGQARGPRSRRGPRRRRRAAWRTRRSRGRARPRWSGRVRPQRRHARRAAGRLRPARRGGGPRYSRGPRGSGTRRRRCDRGGRAPRPSRRRRHWPGAARAVPFGPRCGSWACGRDRCTTRGSRPGAQVGRLALEGRGNGKSGEIRHSVVECR